jgi:uncharacterized repeat protein (TIGR02543 family)
MSARRPLAVAAAALALLLASCPTPIGKAPPVTLTVRADRAAGSGRTVDFADPVVASFELWGAPSGDALALLATWPDLSAATVTLEPGNWDFSLRALDAADGVVLAGGLSGYALGAASATIAFTLTAQTGGSGTIDLTVSWPAVMDVSVATAAVSVDGGVPAPLALGADSVRYLNLAAASGDRIVAIGLYDADDELLASVFELVWVRDNLTSAATVALAATDFNHPPTAPSGAAAVYNAGVAASGSVELSWTDASNNETGFELRLDDGTPLGSVAGTVEKYTDAAAQRGSTRNYQVRATNRFGASAWVGAAPAVVVPYRVNFEYQDGATAPLVAETGDDFRVSAPTAPSRSGYRFEGWFTAASGGDAWDFGAYAVAADETTLYAQWTALGSVGVSFELNPDYQSFDMAPASATVTRGQSFAIGSANAAMNAGATDWRWYLDNIPITGANSPTYTYTTATTEPLGGHTVAVTARYGGVLYSGSLPITVVAAAALAYSGNGADSGAAPAWNGNAIVQDNTGLLVKSGYEFRGWTKSPDGTGTVYQLDDPIDLAAPATLYAVWTNVVPGAVSGVAAEAGNGYLILSWTDPADADLSYVRIDYVVGGTPRHVNVPRGTESRLITGLSTAPGTWYGFTLTAYDSGGLASAGVGAGFSCAQGTPAAATLTAAASIAVAAGQSGDPGCVDGNAATAQLQEPTLLATDGSYVYFTDVTANVIRRLAIASGDVDTLVGTIGVAGAVDDPNGDGDPGTQATFDGSVGLATDGRYLYVADANSHTIRRIDLISRAVTTIAGSPGESGEIDGIGAAARFNRPIGLAADGLFLYVADFEGSTIRRIDLATFEVATIAGVAGVPCIDDDPDGDADPGTQAGFGAPAGLATDGTDLYISDAMFGTVRRLVLATGVVSTVAGTAGSPGAADDPDGFADPGTQARFNMPVGLALNGTTLYLADIGNGALRKIALSTGVVSTISTPAMGLNTPEGVAAVGLDLYVADRGNHTIRRVSP